MAMSDTPPGQMSREELEDEVHDLRERLGDMEDTVDFMQTEFQDMKEAVFGEYTSMTTPANLDGRSVVETLIDIEENGSGSIGGISEVARSQMVEAHRKLLDWRQGADSSLTESEVRGVVLFRQFIRNLDDGRSMTGVSAEYGKYKIMSDRASHILDEEGLLGGTGESVKKKRAMKKVVKMSTLEDCDCSEDACEHALFDFHNDEGYILSVDQDDWMDYVASVQSAIEGVEIDAQDVGDEGSATAADDGDTSPEDAVAQEEERLLNATREDEVANTVVSGSDESVLAGGESPNQDT